MSPNPQSKTYGRHAIYNLSKSYNVKAAEVSNLLNEWTRLKIITFRERVTRKHPAGYQVTGTLD